MFKKFYKHFLEANKEIQHYACHSHHYWPDITRLATLQYWDDSAKMVDDKWDYFFSTKIPHTQKLIGEVLHVSHPEQIVFAPNTHEFVYRILSCFDLSQPLRILTTDSEFHSFERQINRLSEQPNVKVDKVKTLPFKNFENTFIEKIEQNSYDLIFFSHVFFNSGLVVPSLEKIVNAVKSSNTIIVIDGYHGFMALPTNLSLIQDKVFYLAGAYKYAQGGEGCCFMYVPISAMQRPLYTGWFAGFSDLSQKAEKVNYSPNGFRFAGATMDFTALYRLEAVLELFKKEKISVEMIHAHVQKMQKNFLAVIRNLKSNLLKYEDIILHDLKNHGHFFAFELNDPVKTKELHDILYKNKIRTDYRHTRLRFGFGLYQDETINLNAVIKEL